MLGEACRMNLEDLHARCLVRQWNLDLAVEPPRTQQRRIQHIRPICCHDHLDLAQDVKAIKLTQQLHERALDLAVGAGALAKATPTDCVNFVHEDDTRLVITCIPKHLADHARRLANVLVHNRGGHHLKEVGIDVGSNGTRQQSLTSAWRAVQKHTLWWVDAYAYEKLWVHKRQLNRLPQLTDLFRQTTNLGVVNLARIL
mmetsp:Transcript_44288/g.132617  ORF Transcript_44288/g.132617 Transcript_44288/m.132617 type:complete len:200 (+) Transcript_44288:650-1249(+)